MSRVVKEEMGVPRVSRRSLRWSPLVALLALGACTSVLGIEDLHEEPRPGTGGDATTGGTETTTSGKNAGGKSNPSGGSNTTAGTTNEGGAGPGTGGTGTAGTANMAGNGDVAGAGGAVTEPGDTSVHGHVIDALGHKLANIPVQIGGTLVSTDDNGAFVIDNVAAIYEVSLDLEFNVNASHRSFAWVFQGLTRRDPTLEVRWGLPVRYGNILVTPQNVTVAANQTITVAIGGPEGNTELQGVGANGVDTDATWEGGTTTQETAHGLYYAQNAKELPTSYLAYDTSLVALSEASGNKAKITLDLTKVTVDSGNLQGTATAGAGGDRTNEAFLRFDTGAFMRIINDAPGPNAFSYLLPSIPKSTITVAASEGDAYYGSYAVAHADGLSTSSKPALKIPTAATITSPADQLDTVTAATKFTFQSPASNPGPFVVSFENVDQNGPFQILFVVTAQKQITIPEVLGGGFALKHEQSINWRIETNGKFASVDEMTGPKGFLDSYDQYGFEGGTKLDSGEYTISSSRLFKLAK